MTRGLPLYVRNNFVPGERHVQAKLTLQDARQIRDDYATGAGTQRELAAAYGVDRTTVQKVVENRTWRES